MPPQALKEMDWTGENESARAGEGRHGLHLVGEESSGENTVPFFEWYAGKREGGGSNELKKGEDSRTWVLTLTLWESPHGPLLKLILHRK